MNTSSLLTAVTPPASPLPSSGHPAAALPLDLLALLGGGDLFAQALRALPGAAPAAEAAPQPVQAGAESQALPLDAAMAGLPLPEQILASMGEQALPVEPGEASPDANPGAEALVPPAAYAMALMGLLPAAAPLPRPPAEPGGQPGVEPLQITGQRLLAETSLPSSPVSVPAALTPAMQTPGLPLSSQAVFEAGKGAVAEAQPGSDLFAALETLRIEAGSETLAPAGGASLQPARRSSADGASALPLRGEPNQWQQPLMQALGDRLQLQISARSEQAVIRLEPPQLGQVEIAIRQQGSELQVRLSASHAEVTRQLQQVSEGLRQDLVQRHSGEVSVQVAAGGREADARSGSDGRGAFGGASQGEAQQQQQQQRQPGRALHEEDGAGSAGFANALNRRSEHEAGVAR